MDTNRKILLTVGAAVGLGVLVYYLSDDGKGSSRSGTLLRVDQVITILKDLKKELGNVYLTISTFANSINERANGRLPPAALKEILITQTPIQSFITKAESKVYEQHGITESDLQTAVNEYKSDNSEIKQLLQDMKSNLELAYTGVQPTDDNPLPAAVTAEMILKIVYEMYDVSKYITFKHFTLLKNQGIPKDINNEGFLRAIQTMEAEAEEEKLNVFTKNGLDQFEDSPMSLLQKAQKKFSSQDTKFKEKVMMLEQEYSYSMSLLMQDQLPQSEVDRLIKTYGPIE